MMLDWTRLDWTRAIHSLNSRKPLGISRYDWWYPIETWSIGIIPISILLKELLKNKLIKLFKIFV